MKPILKWAGGKYKLLPQIKEMLPPGISLIEPFAGGASVSLNVEGYERYWLNDSNKDLINFYRFLIEYGEDIIPVLEAAFTPDHNTPEYYYSARHVFNTTQDFVNKCVHFLYLNRHCYNGLMRYNQKGKFNVSFGKYKKPYFPKSEILDFIKKGPNISLSSVDFQTVMRPWYPGSVIYCDPPFVPLSSTANFTEFTYTGFGLKDQQRLVQTSKECAACGIPVLISNHDTELTRELYKEATEIRSLDVQRNISCKTRGKVKELLALYTI